MMRRRHCIRVAASSGGPERPGDPRRNNANNMSRVEAFMRTTPPLNNFVDGKLLLGDAVMVLATEAASERVPLDQMPQLAASLIIAWVLAGTFRGDYRAEEDPDNDNPLASAMGWPILVAIVNACITWAVSMGPAMVCYTYLVSHFLVEPNSVLTCRGEHLLGPQMEVGARQGCAVQD